MFNWSRAKSLKVSEGVNILKNRYDTTDSDIYYVCLFLCEKLLGSYYFKMLESEYIIDECYDKWAKECISMYAVGK